MMKNKMLSLACACLFLAACASQPKVYSDFDPEQDFSQYSTFSWMGDKPMSVQSEYVISPLVEQRIKNAVRAALESKGYVFVDDQVKADMGIAFTVGARDKTRVTQEPAMFGATSWRWGQQYWGLSAPLYTETTRVYSKGTLAVDVFDMQRNAPVWHGVSSKTLSSEEKAGQEEFVNAAVAVVLQSFPAK